ncbi:MAG TPA: polyprenyl synthetase family protein [Salinimicrobium sp.]|nr:polyprenyl synthetase family protein [Salinimicrobium sp.]
MYELHIYQESFDQYLKDKVTSKEPRNLYEPISYILNLGGKRLRPVLLLLVADLFSGKYKNALDAALAVEVFHNFSLVHDDIMDAAPLRRGEATVHEKWDVNTAILSGDAMLINAYRLFENYPDAVFKELATLFSTTAIQVCEGQQYDIDFATMEDVSIAQYIHMIEYKTAVLVGASLQMGAIIAESSVECKTAIYEFGKLLGTAFQIQDDYLDVFGDPIDFGKQVGGDIIENKKTYLYLKALEQADEKNKQQLLHLYSINPVDAKGKIDTVKSLFLQSKADEATKNAIQEYTEKAFSVLEKMDLSEAKKEPLRRFGENLMNRQY